MTNPGGYVESDFPGFGVKVFAPSWVSVSLTRIEPDPAYGRSQPGFTFRRLIGNLKFVASGSDQFTFDPPVRFQAAVPDELRPLRASLKLAWWNGSEWVRLADAGGDPNNLIVAIASITDPPISWGT